MLNRGGFSAYEAVFKRNPADLHMWQDGGNEPDFAQGASASSQFARQCKLRDTAQEATLAEMTTTHLGRRLARNQTFRRPEISVRGPVSS